LPFSELEGIARFLVVLFEFNNLKNNQPFSSEWIQRHMVHAERPLRWCFVASVADIWWKQGVIEWAGYWGEWAAWKDQRSSPPVVVGRLVERLRLGRWEGCLWRVGD
jgi:hypothetical protein